MKRKVVLLIGIITVLLFVLSGCSTYGTIEGEVINKKYEEALFYTTTMLVGKTVIPITHHVPEQYKIEISKQENEEIKTKWVNISQEEYNKIEVGDWYEGEK